MTKLSDWVASLYGYDRMKEYNKNVRSIPSGPSIPPKEEPVVSERRSWPSFTDYRTSSNSWNHMGGYNSYNSPGEKLVLGGKDITVYPNSLLVVPEGELSQVPEKYRHITIELPHSYGFAIIR